LRIAVRLLSMIGGPPTFVFYTVEDVSPRRNERERAYGHVRKALRVQSAMISLITALR